jgi:catechol 1,2-dioxygenase
MPFHLRGMLLTDERGRYEIETIIPGAYPIPPGMPGLEKYGGLTRARHIHISVMPFLNVPLTTQLYFKDDPNIPSDPWAGHKPQLVLNPRSDGKYLKADFDFVLNSGLLTD